jgi:integrase
MARPPIWREVSEFARESDSALSGIELLLGHASVQTTERYLGTKRTKQDLVHAPNDGIKLRVGV